MSCKHRKIILVLIKANAKLLAPAISELLELSYSFSGYPVRYALDTQKIRVHKLFSVSLVLKYILILLKCLQICSTEVYFNPLVYHLLQNVKASGLFAECSDARNKSKFPKKSCWFEYLTKRLFDKTFI